MTYKDADASVLDSLGGALKDAAPEEALVKTANSSHTKSGVTSSVEEKALQLLGAGVSSEQVASAVGVTPSRIAQLMSEKHFADKVSALRYNALQKHNTRDNKYDSVEDLLLEKLERSLPLMIRPDTIMKAIQVVNGAKRRGTSAPTTINNTQNVVQLVLPSVITQKFATDINNQVIKAGDQSLLTMPSSQLLKMQTESSNTEAKELPNVPSERSSS